MDAILSNLPAILSIALGVGIIWKFLDKVITLIREIKEVLDVTLAALADKKLTKDEINQIVKEAKDVPAALKNILNKKDNDD